MPDPLPLTPAERAELGRLAEALSATATVTKRRIAGTGSERGCEAWICDSCDEGIIDGDVLAGGPENIAHRRECPLHPARVLPVRAGLLRRLLADLSRVEGERDEARAERDYVIKKRAQADRNVALAHAILDRAGIPAAPGAACDDPACESHLTHRAHEIVAGRDTARAEADRLRDLVRHQRGELHDAGLLTDEEYAALAGDHGAVARLEGYDEVRAESARLTRELAEARATTANAERAAYVAALIEGLRQAAGIVAPPGLVASPERVAVANAIYARAREAERVAANLALAGSGT